jgi:hypothetical protein
LFHDLIEHLEALSLVEEPVPVEIILSKDLVGEVSNYVSDWRSAHVSFDELSHLRLRNEPVVVQIDFGEELVEFSDSSRRLALGDEEIVEELQSLSPVEEAASIEIVLDPDLVHDGADLV